MDDLASINPPKLRNIVEKKENNLLLDATSFLCDIDSIILNETSTNVSDVMAGPIYIKETETYDICFRYDLVHRERL